MSICKDIYDELVKILHAELVHYRRMPNAYTIDENSATLLKNSFGVQIREGTNTERFVGCIASWQRNYVITLVKQVAATENDIDKRAGIETILDDDRHAVFKAIESNQTLNGKAVNCKIITDGGIEYLDGQTAKFVAIEMILNVEYLEQL